MPPADLAAAVFLAFLGAAAWSDVRKLEIPNLLCAVFAAAFIPCALLLGLGWLALGLHLAAGLIVLMIGFALFQFGVFGGGDAKLLAAAAVWTGFAGLGPFAFYVAVAGGGLAAAFLLARRLAPAPAGATGLAARLLTPRTGIPYGVAIAIGGAMALSHFAWR